MVVIISSFQKYFEIRCTYGNPLPIPESSTSQWTLKSCSVTFSTLRKSIQNQKTVHPFNLNRGPGCASSFASIFRRRIPETAKVRWTPRTSRRRRRRVGSNTRRWSITRPRTRRAREARTRQRWPSSYRNRNRRERAVHRDYDKTGRDRAGTDVITTWIHVVECKRVAAFDRYYSSDKIW